MSVPNPYTPGTGIFPPHFAGRSREKKIFEKKLEEASDGNLRAVAIVGEWGVGKTSLLKVFQDMASQRGSKAVLIRCYPTASPMDFCRLLTSKLFMAAPMDVWKKLKAMLGSFGFTIGPFGISLEKSKREIEPQSFFTSVFQSVWDDLKLRKPIVLLVDDVQEIIRRDSPLTILKNSITEAVEEGWYFLPVITGTPDLFEMFAEVSHPLTRFFDPQTLKRLDEKESREAILRPLEGTGVSFDAEVVNKVVDMAEGHPYYLQSICYHTFENRKRKRVTLESFRVGLDEAIGDMGERLFKQRYQRASDKEKDVLNIVARTGGPVTFSEIVKEGERKNIAFGTVSTSLTRLTRYGLIERPERGKYKVKDKLFEAYVRTL